MAVAPLYYWLQQKKWFVSRCFEAERWAEGSKDEDEPQTQLFELMDTVLSGLTQTEECLQWGIPNLHIRLDLCVNTRMV